MTCGGGPPFISKSGRILSTVLPATCYLPPVHIGTQFGKENKKRKDKKKKKDRRGSHLPPTSVTHNMEVIMPMLPDQGDSSWSDGHSSASDDHSSILLAQSPTWGNPTMSMTMTRLETGQLSPISTEMEIPVVGTSITSMIHSATSSSNGSWSTAFSDGGDAEDGEHDMLWDQCSDDVLTIPKVEPLDDDGFRMDGLQEAPISTPQPASCLPAQGVKIKRPRGRPRKHPLVPHAATNKIAKGRSKTGCITCRKRKKKCDETKPRCKLAPHATLPSTC